MSRLLDYLDLESIVLGVIVGLVAIMFVGYAAVWVATTVALVPNFAFALECLLNKKLGRTAMDAVKTVLINMAFWSFIIGMIAVMRKMYGY